MAMAPHCAAKPSHNHNHHHATPSISVPRPLAFEYRGNMQSAKEASGGFGGWRAALGSNREAVALYRISLGVTLFVELASRFQYFHAFYSGEG